MPDELDRLTRRLAELSNKSPREISRWLMAEANARGLRPVTFARKRLEELRTYTPRRLINTAKANGRLRGIPHEDAMKTVRAMSRAARKRITPQQAWDELEALSED